MRPARALTIGSVPPAWGGRNYGGVARFHGMLIEALLPGRHPAAEIVGVITGGVSAPAIPVPHWTLARGQRRADFLSETLAEVQPDVVIMQHFTHAWGDLLPKVAPGLPLVGIAHSWHHITLKEDQGERQEAIAHTQRTLGDLDTLIVVSDHTRREGRSLGLKYPGKTLVIHNPVPPEYSSPLEATGPRSGVVFVGGLHPRKNPVGTVEAVALLEGVPLVVAGHGPEEAALREKVDELGIEDRVSFVRADDAEMRRLLARAEVLCVPSHSESFGIVYLEALACGTPVVGFGPTLREIGRATGVRFGAAVDHPTPESIATAVEQVRVVSWQRDLLRRSVLRAFPLDRIAAQYADALARAAAPLRVPRKEIERRVAQFPSWHYEFDLGGVRTPLADPAKANRHAERRRYLMDPLLEACGGSLQGKRVLDLGCNAGFWSLRAAEAGAEFVLGVDGRAMHVEQARLVFEVMRVPPARYEFRLADVFELDLAEATFDVVLCLGLLYHVDRPVELIESAARWTRDLLLVDTSLSLLPGSALQLMRESTEDPRNALASSLVVRPTRQGVIDMVENAGLQATVLEPAFADYSGARDFLEERRRAFLCRRIPGGAGAC
jgi:tRNA (mo5U34)-methyltransferase